MYKIVRIFSILFFLLSFAYTSAFASKEYTGVVTSLNITKHPANYDASYAGVIGNVVRPGYIGKPIITRTNDDKIIQGAPLFEYEMPYWDYLVEGYKYLTKYSKVQTDEARLNLARYSKLVKPGAVAEQQREQYVSAYISAINDYEVNKAMIANKYENVREAMFRPPFEGIVTNVYQTTGIANGQMVLEYAQLNPIGIKVVMDRSEARKLSNQPVKIYPATLDKPQGILYGRTLLTDDGVMFVTENCPLSTVSDPNFKTRVHRDYGLVISFFQDNNNSILAVPQKAICKDNTNTYVWKAVDQRDMVPGKGISDIFTVRKIYINPDDMLRKSAGFQTIQALKNPTPLKLNDILVINPPKDLNDGDKLLFAQDRYLMMPGENVRVVIGKE